jgi:hypothetical protein
VLAVSCYQLLDVVTADVVLDSTQGPRAHRSFELRILSKVGYAGRAGASSWPASKLAMEASHPLAATVYVCWHGAAQTCVCTPTSAATA